MTLGCDQLAADSLDLVVQTIGSALDTLEVAIDACKLQVKSLVGRGHRPHTRARPAPTALAPAGTPAGTSKTASVSAIPRTTPPAGDPADPLRHVRAHSELHGAFGADTFGRRAEAVARLFGTPQYIVGQTVLVVIWIALNALAVSLRWDPYPFILLNLAFSTQAAYAAPLILLAQTRQADRDKASETASAIHAEELSTMQMDLLRQNTELTERVAKLSEDIDQLTHSIHEHVTSRGY